MPCLDEARHIDPLLGQLAAARKRLGGRIVVADGGSTDGTRAIVSRIAAREPGIVLLENPARIQSAGINLAVGRFGAEATHLIRVDAHCAYPGDYCDILLAEAEATGAASVVVGMVAEGAGRLQRAIAAAQNTSVGNGGSKHRRIGAGEWVDHGHHALIRLDAFADVGGYDPSFTHNEDAELDHRLTMAGHRIWLTGRTHAVYFPRDAFPSLARQYFNYGAGRARNILKHRSWPKPRQAKVIAIAPVVAAASLAPLHPLCALPFLAWLTLCAASGLALAVRARDIRLVVAAPAAMVMHLSWSVGFWSEVGAFRRPTAAGQA